MIPFSSADILLPDFGKTDGTKYAVIACDQFTSDPSYWESAKETVSGAPSTLSMILPEVYLNEAPVRLPSIHAAMNAAEKTLLSLHAGAMIYVERTQSDGTLRRGIVGKVDLEEYDYSRTATSLIRATEGTVLERIPPRVAVRRGAPLELPHAMLLIDDAERTVIEPCENTTKMSTPIYDFSLMLGGGHIRGYLVSDEEQQRIIAALAALTDKNRIEGLSPLLFAVGDGNHSLASAKAYYEEIKASLGAEAAATHPARYALCEVVNLHDDGLSFEPIYRVVFNVDTEDLISDFKSYLARETGNLAPQAFTVIVGATEREIVAPHPKMQLPVATLQVFLDNYLASHPEASIDYIHGESETALLAKKENAVGFLFRGMEKSDFFPSIVHDGALPRKTFSMGHARDKRYYLEARSIQKKD